MSCSCLHVKNVARARRGYLSKLGINRKLLISDYNTKSIKITLYMNGHLHVVQSIDFLSLDVELLGATDL